MRKIYRGMKVFKFGGASVSTTERIKNLSTILKVYQDQKLLIIISAIGKTTNALEKVTEAFHAGQKDVALNLFNEIKQQHIQTIEELELESTKQLLDFFTEVEWILHDKPNHSYDYYYDQIVCIGELLSSSIISSFLNKSSAQNKWIDVRDILRTDNNFRDATIDWGVSSENVEKKLQPLFSTNNIIITQGFIAATDENESTTLGREGSDYTAAVFANLLNAESQTIWKDVPGVMNADPKQYTEAKLIRELNYREVIEMAYYGAQVIHPKTIKPLQNKSIPLYVRSFIHPDEEGTIIHNKSLQQLPSIIVYKQNQVLLQLASKDFSFVSEGLTTRVYEIFEELKFKPNLTQNAAISFLCVVDDHAEKVENFALESSKEFDVQVVKKLLLLTIRHYNDPIVRQLTENRKIILKQQTPETIQVLLQ